MTSHYCSSITRLSEDSGPASKEPNEHPMRRDAFITHHTLYHYFKTSKNSPKRQKKKVRSSKEALARQMISYLMPVGEDSFCSYCILYNYFKISKCRKKNTLIIKRNTSQVNDIILDACMKFKNYLIKTKG